MSLKKLICLATLFLLATTALAQISEGGCSPSTQVCLSLLNGDILYESSVDIAGFQWSHDGCISGVHGGAAGKAGFPTDLSEFEVMGFAPHGTSIPSGVGQIIGLRGNVTQECMSDFFFVNSANEELSSAWGSDAQAQPESHILATQHIRSGPMAEEETLAPKIELRFGDYSCEWGEEVVCQINIEFESTVPLSHWEFDILMAGATVVGPPHSGVSEAYNFVPFCNPVESTKTYKCLAFAHTGDSLSVDHGHGNVLTVINVKPNLGSSICFMESPETPVYTDERGGELTRMFLSKTGTVTGPCLTVSKDHKAQSSEEEEEEEVGKKKKKVEGVHDDSKGVRWVRIVHCEGPSATDRMDYTADKIKAKAAFASQVKICTKGSAVDCVVSKPDSGPIKDLRQGRSISSWPCDRSCVADIWSGPEKRLRSLVVNEGGRPQNNALEVKNNNLLYAAAGNANGLHISAVHGNDDKSQRCSWTFNRNNNLEVFVDSKCAPTCFGHSCDHWVETGEGYTCESLEADGCDCTQCSSCTASRDERTQLQLQKMVDDMHDHKPGQHLRKSEENAEIETSEVEVPHRVPLGRPHLKNMKGEAFDLFQVGTHKLLEIPRSATRDGLKFALHAQIARPSNMTCGPTYITEVKLSGQWMGGAKSVEFRSGDPKTSKPFGFRMGSMMWMSQGEVRRPMRIAKNVTGLDSDVTLKSVDKALVMEIGPLKLTVKQAKPSAPRFFLDINIAGLHNIWGQIGGLLGVDDHSEAAAVSEECASKPHAEYLEWSANADL